MTLRSGVPLAVWVGVAPLVTYSQLPSMERAAATGLLPTGMLPVTTLVV